MSTDTSNDKKKMLSEKMEPFLIEPDQVNLFIIQKLIPLSLRPNYAKVFDSTIQIPQEITNKLKNDDLNFYKHLKEGKIDRSSNSDTFYLG